MITPDINLLMPTPKDQENLKSFLEYVKNQKTVFVTELPAIIPEEPLLFVVVSGSDVLLTAAVNGKYYQVTLSEVE